MWMVGVSLLLGAVGVASAQSEETLPEVETDLTHEDALLRASNADQRDGFGGEFDRWESRGHRGKE